MKSSMPAAFMLVLAACTSPQAPPDTATAPATISTAARPRIGIPNPASVSCTQQGGRVNLRRDATGNISGSCVFPDGRECEEWALYRDHQCIASPQPATAASGEKP